MFNFFRKKPKEEPKDNRTKKVLKYQDQIFDVGKSIVRVTFEDGRTFKTPFFGDVSQYSVDGKLDMYSYWVDAIASGPCVFTSLHQINNAMLYNNGETKTYLNDEFGKATQSASGRVIHMKVVNTRPFFKSFRVTSVVEVPYE